MPEEWKKDISKEFIKEKVLNKDLLEIQESLKSLKDSIGISDDKESNKGYFGIDNIMNIIFNKEGKVRSKIGFETSKLKSIMYMMISQEGKENLDLLYNELEKSNSESELRENLGFELSNLESEVKNDNQTEDNGEQTNNEGNNNEQENNDENNDENNNGNNGEQNENGSDNQDNISNMDETLNMDETKIESLNNNENYIVNQAKLYGVTDNRQIAYILATVKGECGFKNIKEIGGEKRSYGKEGYYGRGYVQLTHKGNYKKFTNIIQKSGLNFKDNNGNILNGKTIDLVKNPDLILQSNDLAAFILVYGMRNGSFTGKKLDNYINNQKCDFKNARRIINGTDHADKFVGFAEDYLNKLGGKNKGLENNNEKLLIGPELLANNRDELGGLGSSIMVGIQGKNKSQFKNMDGIKSATTRNQDWFWKEGKKGELDKEKIKNYCNSKGIKSFLFYFGGNEAFSSVDAVNNAYNDIESMSKYLNSIGVQPVLCTCMGEKIEGHSVGGNGKIYPLADGSDGTPGFNNKIRNLGKEMNWPVMDFASIDNKIPKGSDKIHPNGSGYQIMRREIDKCLVYKKLPIR